MDVWRIGPTHVDFNVTNGCNLACTHCHSSSGAKLPAELSTAEITGVLDELHALGVMRIAIAGGEPFIRRDILDILEHACRLPGWRVAVITNGLFFRTREQVARLAERCPGLSVNVSLDGSTARGFHVLRRQARRPDQDPGPMFDQISAGIRALVDAGMTTAVNVTLSRPTIHDWIPTYRFAAQELGASAVVGIKFFPGGYGKTFRDMLELPFDQWSAEFARVTQAKIDGELPGMQVSVPAPWEFYLPLLEAGIDVHDAERAWGYRAPLREDAYSSVFSMGDTAGTAELSIAGDGTVYPSVLFSGMTGVACGNIRDQSLAQIWAASPVFASMRTLELTDLAADCHACAFSTVCGGGSRARAFADTGQLNGIDGSCPLVHGAQPSPVRAPQALSAAVSPSEMHLLGRGRDAIRVFFTREGCQVRVNGHILTCGPEDAAVLRAAVAGGESTASAAPGTANRPSHGTTDALLTTLQSLGAPPDAVSPLRELVAVRPE